MAGITLTPALRTEYGKLFESCVIRTARLAEVTKAADQLIASRARYEQVTASSGVPWPMTAVVHNMESSQNFTRHLHNGDPLTARTVKKPAGRPKAGMPPFTWEVSTADALSIHNLDADTDWSVAGMLYALEAYNGWGYRKSHPHVLSPYLWAGSEHYTAGKYVDDGTWSEVAVSKQIGAAVLLRRLAERGAFVFADQPKPTENKPLLVTFRTTLSSDPVRVEQAKDLQRWLNTHTGIFVLVDGVPGKRTSDAFRAVTGAFLPGDPRG
jgi:lysozyme family protein